MYQQHSAVTFDDGGIVRSWRDVITKKYVNLPGIHSFHNLYNIKKNPGFNAEMKVRDECYVGPLKRSSMKFENGYTPADIAFLKVSDTYVSYGKSLVLTDRQLAHVKQMCNNFIPEDQWREIIKRVVHNINILCDRLRENPAYGTV